ncbi:2-methylcitrate dehydratase PrpD [Viridothelium virens]|uniref:2-methylcitrate dehydratase PrpD n=1 Tax=Viridothelium virens TaxID=1048519 RepID=A0A6A6GW04_VIRVR|nr:2-methylcitrate dehydratase PrpD [Viridothelium virens]
MRSYDGVHIDITHYVYHYRICNPESLQRARMLLLDSLSCAMETIHDGSVRQILGPHVSQTVVTSGFRLPGTSIIEDSVKGAFDLGTLIRYLDHNDALGGASSMNKNSPPPTIRTLLEAMIKAYEIQGCLQLANAFNEHGLDHTILVKVAAAAVVSRLLGLTEEQALAALAHAWMDGHPLRTFRASPNTVGRKGWAAGDACMRAVHLTLLVRNGQEGAPNPLTASRWGFNERLFGSKEFKLPLPYRENIIHRTIMKLTPTEGHTLTAAVAALQLAKKLKQGQLFTASDRDHCMQYIVTVILLKNEQIESTDYRDESPWASSSDVEDLRKRIVMKEDETFSRDYYNPDLRSVPNGIKITFRDGKKLDEVVVHIPSGHPAHPNTPQDAAAKFQKNMGLLFFDEEIRRIKMHLEDDEFCVKDFVDFCIRPGPKL